MSNIPTLLKIHESDISEIRFSSNVAGTTFIKNSDKVLRLLKEKVPSESLCLFLFREPENEFDPEAVRVEIGLKGSSKHGKIGYVPKDRAPLIGYVLQHPEQYTLFINNVSLIGGDEIRKNIGIFFDYRIYPKKKDVIY